MLRHIEHVFRERALARKRQHYYAGWDWVAGRLLEGAPFDKMRIVVENNTHREGHTQFNQGSADALARAEGK